MLFMVIETFRNQDAKTVYRRFRDKGRMTAGRPHLRQQLGCRRSRPVLPAHGGRRCHAVSALGRRMVRPRRIRDRPGHTRQIDRRGACGPVVGGAAVLPSAKRISQSPSCCFFRGGLRPSANPPRARCLYKPGRLVVRAAAGRRNILFPAPALICVNADYACVSTLRLCSIYVLRIIRTCRQPTRSDKA